MADKAPVWQALVAHNQLRPTPYDDLALWTYGDFVFTPYWDHLLATTRAREHGFHEFVNTERMIFGMFDRLREWRIIPPA